MAAGRVRRRALVIIGAVVVVALAGSFGVAQQRRAAASDRWVTATATTGSVTQTLSGSGTVSPAEDASASFPASGKVTAVKVSVGQTVKAGDVLATMDETSLQTAVDQAALTLAQARETLAETETAAASASAASASAATASSTAGSRMTSSSRSSSSATSSATSSSRTTIGGTASAAQRLQAQKKVVARAQSGFDSAWAAFSTQLSTTTTACDAVASTSAVASTTPSASTAAVASTSSPSPSSPSSSESAPSASSAVSSAAPVDTQKCLASLDTLAAKQDAVSSARGSLETAVNRIVALAVGTGTSANTSTATASAQSRSGTAGTGAPSAAASSGTGTGQGGSSSQGGQGGESKTVAQAAAAVAQAKLDLTTAQVALTNAAMTAPISGTISAVPFAVGDEASTSDTVDIVGGTGVTLALSIGEDDIRSVKTGQSVAVSSAAGSTSEGTVSAIGILASSGTTSEVSYPVTVEVLDAGSGLVSGTTASALVTIASAKRATLVPVSAVTLVGDSTGIVKVVGSDHAVTATRVGLGAIGSTQVQITKGISSGATVALADSTSDLPTSGSTSTGGMGMGGGQGGGNAPDGQGGGGQGPR